VQLDSDFQRQHGSSASQRHIHMMRIESRMWSLSKKENRLYTADS
jgi:hypothetical protein